MGERGRTPTETEDQLYLHLKGARERLCLAQHLVPPHWTSDLSQAIRIIDEAGSSLVPIGRFYGVDMGRGIVRIGTTPNCPRHDACRGFTKALRATRPSWSNPWCPKHPKGPCPPGSDREEPTP